MSPYDLTRKVRQQFLGNVHPGTLPAFGHSAEDVRQFLESIGYDIRVLAVDDEEHWWCTDTAPHAAAQPVL
jgi:hypothetical protein